MRTPTLASTATTDERRADALEAIGAVLTGVIREGNREMVFRILGWAGLATAVAPILFDTVQYLSTGSSLLVPPEHIGIGFGGAGIGMIGLAVSGHIREKLGAVSRMLRGESS